MKSSQDVRFVRQSQVFASAAPQWVAIFAENASFSRLLRHDGGQIPLSGTIPVVVISDGVVVVFSVVGGVVVVGAAAPSPHHVFSAHWLHQDSSSCLQAPFDHKQESQLPHSAARPHHVFPANWVHQDASSCLQTPLDHKQESQLPHSVELRLEPRSDSEAPTDARPLTARLTAKTIAVDAFIMVAR